MGGPPIRHFFCNSFGSLPGCWWLRAETLCYETETFVPYRLEYQKVDGFDGALTRPLSGWQKAFLYVAWPRTCHAWRWRSANSLTQVRYNPHRAARQFGYDQHYPGFPCFSFSGNVLESAGLQVLALARRGVVR